MSLPGQGRVAVLISQSTIIRVLFYNSSTYMFTVYDPIYFLPAFSVLSASSATKRVWAQFSSRMLGIEFRHALLQHEGIVAINVGMKHCLDQLWTHQPIRRSIISDSQPCSISMRDKITVLLLLETWTNRSKVSIEAASQEPWQMLVSSGSTSYRFVPDSRWSSIFIHHSWDQHYSLATTHASPWYRQSFRPPRFLNRF